MAHLGRGRWHATLNCIATVAVPLALLVAGQPRAVLAAAALQVSTVMGTPGQLVSFQVSLSTGGAAIAGTQNDLSFDALSTPIGADAHGNPLCTVNSAIQKEGTTFAFEPPGCAPGATCTGIRAIVFSLRNSNPIPEGSALYSCTVEISAHATPGTYPVDVSGIVLSDPNGIPVPGGGAVNGAVVVTLPTPTPTPTPVQTVSCAARSS